MPVCTSGCTCVFTTLAGNPIHVDGVGGCPPIGLGVNGADLELVRGLGARS